MTGQNLIITGLILILCFSCERRASDSSIEVMKFRSQTFDNERNIRVYLPAGYDKGNSYEVLYLNDGQNAFKNDSLPIEENWRVDQIADSLIRLEIIRPIIIVAIDHLGYKQRSNEFLPWEDIYLNPPNSTPQGKDYPEFLVDELIPFINSNYQTKTDRLSTGLGGFSYGGLITTYTAIVQNRFGKLLVESPSLYVNEQAILEVLSQKTTIPPMRWHVGIGTNELNIKDCDESNPDNLMAINDVTSLLSQIQEKAPDSKIQFEKTKCGVHSYQEASRRLAKALIFLYGPNN